MQLFLLAICLLAYASQLVPSQEEGPSMHMDVYTHVMCPHMLSCLVQDVLRCPLRRFTLIHTHTHAQKQIHVHACYTYAAHGAFVAVCAPIPGSPPVCLWKVLEGAQQCSAPHFALSRRRVCVSVVFRLHAPWKFCVDTFCNHCWPQHQHVYYVSMQAHMDVDF